MENFTLLFDLDGTLVNTDNIYCEVWNELLSKDLEIEGIMRNGKIVKGVR